MAVAIQNANACSCVPANLKIDSLSQLKKYVFIAHVKILDAHDSSTQAAYTTTGVLRFEILELFKGDHIDTILELSKNTSCDLGISSGEEWVLFAYLINGKISIDACDRNVRYKETNGLRDWRYDIGYHRLQINYETLYDSYGRSINWKQYTRLGKLAEEFTTDPDRKFSTSIFYHENGLVRSISYVLNDQSYGRSEEYDQKGVLIKTWEYDEHGKLIRFSQPGL